MSSKEEKDDLEDREEEMEVEERDEDEEEEEENDDEEEEEEEEDARKGKPTTAASSNKSTKDEVEDDDDDDADAEREDIFDEMGVAEIPVKKNNMRACISCMLIKEQSQFLEHGCENCEEVLKMRDSLARVKKCTTTNFEGMTAMMAPKQSWVARWQLVDTRRPGIYALSVRQRLENEDAEKMRKKMRPVIGEVLAQLQQQAQTQR